MGQRFLVIAGLMFGFAFDASAESLYLTTSEPLANVGYTSNRNYTFIAPYFVDVATKISVGVAKGTTSSNQMGSPTAVKITGGAWTSANGGEIAYQVSCDLTSVLPLGSHITISGFPGDSKFNASGEVKEITDSAVVVSEPAPAGDYPKGSTGSITGEPCPSGSGSISVSIGVTPKPIRRAYLYLLTNAFYSDTVNVTVGSDGMLTSSDTSSVQQITTILNELAQTAAAALQPRRLGSKPTPATAREKCFTAIGDWVKPGPFYSEFGLEKKYEKYRQTPEGTKFGWSFPITPTSEVVLRVEPLFQAMPDTIGWTAPGMMGWIQPGLIGFFPVPAEASLLCDYPSETVYLSAPGTVNLYTERHVLDPQRNFLTGPQDTLTFNEGFITAHKYVDQSAAKTIVDTVTEPLRSIFPSLSANQTVHVQTGGGTANGQTTTK
jgi:hypothetical protein